MKSLIFAAVVVIASGYAFADGPASPPAEEHVAATAAPAPVAPAAAPAVSAAPKDAPALPDPAGPTPQDLMVALAAIFTDYKAGGLLAAVAGVLALLVQLSKYDVLRKLLDDRGLGWVRPAVLILVSVVGTVITALSAGAKPGPALLGGVLAGFSSYGLREIVKLLSADERNRVQVDVGAVSAGSQALMKQLNDQAAVAGAEAVGATKARLAALDGLPERTKLEKLAEMLSTPVPNLTIVPPQSKA